MPNPEVLNPIPLLAPSNLGHHTSLTPREEEVLALRASDARRSHEPLSCRATAKALRISRTRVKQVENQLCRKTLVVLFERAVIQSASDSIDTNGYELSAAE